MRDSYGVKTTVVLLFWPPRSEGVSPSGQPNWRITRKVDYPYKCRSRALFVSSIYALGRDSGFTLRRI